MAAPARGGRDHDPVDIDKARIAGAKPEEIRAVVFGVLIERQQEGVEVPDSSRQKCLFNEMLQPRRFEPGQFPRMFVVERKQGLAERCVLRCLGGTN